MQIQTTSDYSLFRRIPGNRTVNKPHVKRLMHSISEDTKLSDYLPVIVNDKMEVIDGQHRLEALKALVLPVHYLIAGGATLAEVQRLNTRVKTWAPIDYARSFAELGNKNYIKYIEYKKQYRFPHNVLVTYLSNKTVGGGSSGSPNSSKEKFRSGRFKIKEEKSAQKLLDQLKKVKRYFSHAGTQTFALAFRRIALNLQFDNVRLIEQMSKHRKMVYTCLTSEEYMRMLEAVYNYHQPEEKRVRFF